MLNKARRDIEIALKFSAKHPEFFENVKAFSCTQPASMNIAMKAIATLQGLGDYMDELDEEQRKLGGFANHEMSPHPYAGGVDIPTFIIQVHEDSWSKPEDVQTTFDKLKTTEKKLVWIEGTTRRFDGYNYFGENPDELIAFFDHYMK